MTRMVLEAGAGCCIMLSIVCVTLQILVDERDMLRKRFKSCFAIEIYILVE